MAQAGESGVEAGAAGAAGEGMAVAERIWNDDSAALSLGSGSYFGGYIGYERTRALLSTEQVDALEEIRTTQERGECSSDGPDTQLLVTDSFGGSVSYHSSGCYNSGQRFDPASAARFLATLPPCVRSKDERTATLDTAPSVAIGDGCQNNIYMNTAPQTPPQWLRLTVAKANTPVLLELVKCDLLTFKLDLLSPTGDTVLASGDTAGTRCQSLNYTFEATGSYAVRLTVTGGQGAGDATFRAN